MTILNPHFISKTEPTRKQTKKDHLSSYLPPPSSAVLKLHFLSEENSDGPNPGNQQGTVFRSCQEVPRERQSEWWAVDRQAQGSDRHMSSTQEQWLKIHTNR